MASKLFIFSIFAIVLLGMIVAQDYEGGDDGESGDDGGSDDAGYAGGDYEETADGGDEAAAGDGEDSDDSAAASQSNLAQLLQHMQRKKRSLNTDNSNRVLSRVRRGGHGVVGPVYTYQKTDHNANFKWGVKHMVGKQYGK